MHSATGVRTWKDEFDKVACHNEHHLGQIRQALQARVDRHSTNPFQAFRSNFRVFL